MEITDTKIRKINHEKDSNMKAVVSITFDDLLAVHDIRIIDGKDRLFVAMPSRKSANGIYKDIVHPISAEFRSYVENEIIKKYHEEMEAEITKNMS